MFTISLANCQQNNKTALKNIHFIGRFRTHLNLNDHEIFLLNGIVHDLLNGCGTGYLKQRGMIARTYEDWSKRCGFSARTCRRFIDKFSKLGIINKEKLDSSRHRVLKGKYPNNTLVISLNMQGFAKYGIDDNYLKGYLKYDKRKVKISPNKNKFGQTLLYTPSVLYNKKYVEYVSPKIDEQKKVIKMDFGSIKNQKLSSEQIKYGLSLEIPRHQLEKSFEKMKDWYIGLGYIQIELRYCDNRWKRWLNHEFLPENLMNIRKEKEYRRQKEAEIIYLKDHQSNDLIVQLKREMANNLPKSVWPNLISPIIAVEFKTPNKLSLKVAKFSNYSALGTVKHIARKIWPEIDFIEAC